MNKIKKYLILAIASVAAMSCDSYFDVNFDDQANLEDIFQQKVFTRRYLAQVYSFIPRDEHFVYGSGFVVARSDESLFASYRWLPSIPYRTGNYSPATALDWGNYGVDLWNSLYIGINQATIFINNVDKDLEDSEDLREIMKAEARFLRAYYYFCLFRQYGPVFIWGDTTPDETIANTDVDRHTVDENIDFIVSELDKAIAVLPRTVAESGESVDQWMGRATKGAAMAVKARVLLYAASPLYNGCDLYKGQMKNKDGNYLFPQSYDGNKWEAAAQAAKAVLDLNQYHLVEKTGQSSKLLDGIKSVQAVRFEPWNEETIWGWWKRVGSSAYDWGGAAATNMMYAMPSNVALYGYSNFSPSLRLVDTYPMEASGRYPVKGYVKVGGLNDLSQPIVDELSGYKTTGFTENYIQPDTEHWSSPIKAHNTTVGRDARFYADVVPNGFWWPNKNAYKGSTHRFACWDNDDAEVRYSASGDLVRVGYVYRKDYPTDKLMATGTDYTSYKVVFPAFRLAEIYLAYAEACNEKPARDEAAALDAINKVRNRAGLNNLEVAYPEVIGNQELLRWCIQREKMVEFAFEAHRHYDACRWMIAKDEYPCENWTLHMSAKKYEDVYNRTRDEFALEPTLFEDKDYLFPLSTYQITNMINITQNYGF